MTARYWCELAWLGGPRAEPGVVIEVDGDRIAGVAAGVRTRPEDAVPLAGLTLPALADAPSRHHLAYRPGVPLIWRTLGAGYRLTPVSDQTGP